MDKVIKRRRSWRNRPKYVKNILILIFKIVLILEIKLEKYWTNPQYLLIITECDIVCKETGTLSIIISLMQKLNHRTLKIRDKNLEVFIQFRLFKVWHLIFFYVLFLLDRFVFL